MVLSSGLIPELMQTLNPSKEIVDVGELEDVVSNKATGDDVTQITRGECAHSSVLFPVGDRKWLIQSIAAPWNMVPGAYGSNMHPKQRLFKNVDMVGHDDRYDRIRDSAIHDDGWWVGPR